MKRNCCNNKTGFSSRLFRIVIVVIILILLFQLVYSNSSVFYRTTVTLPFSLHLNKQKLYLIKGEETRLSVFAINKRVSFYSTNFRVAGVDFAGRVFAYRTGKAFIIAEVGGKKLKCRVYVIDINKKSLEIKEGKSYRLKIKGANAFVRWKSNNPSVAAVTMFGTVKARNRGCAIITARVKGRTLRCTVTVK